MYKHGALFLIISIFIFSSSGGLFAQQKSIDTAQLQRTTTYTAAAFYKTIGLRARLYNGETVDPYDFVSNTISEAQAMAHSLMMSQREREAHGRPTRRLSHLC